MPLVLEELLDDAPVTWARSYGGPLLPPIMLSDPTSDFPRDMPAKWMTKQKRERGKNYETKTLMFHK